MTHGIFFGKDGVHWPQCQKPFQFYMFLEIKPTKIQLYRYPGIKMKMGCLRYEINNIGSKKGYHYSVCYVPVKSSSLQNFGGRNLNGLIALVDC